ncbi:hypothetical protein CIG75_07435 [Tumebacillus algifaecis]|uniref:Uncharacterized protein n=1 Tax=Tumebacillus algifaecis TaxID=1214604 RepID=A0A223D0D0_9BACL|nr:hypothetical protein [Tumebacillus algifaecis]ASS74827.1 hypothetical protein CIG75_07435 [Tumebacillus algifaecis]
MNEKAIPTWLLAVPVIGLGELTYLLYGRLGVGWVTKASFGATVLAAVVFLIIYLMRVKHNRKKS